MDYYYYYFLDTLLNSFCDPYWVLINSAIYKFCRIEFTLFACCGVWKLFFFFLRGELLGLMGAGGNLNFGA